MSAESSSAEPENRRLHLTGLPPGWGNDEVKREFNSFGEITDVVVFRDEFGRARFGFVEFTQRESSVNAAKDMDKRSFDGHSISVTFAQPKPPRGARPGAAGINPSRLFVCNIGAGSTVDVVKAAFEKFGKVLDIHMFANSRDTRSSSRPVEQRSQVAYIQFDTAEEAARAKAAMHLNGEELRGTEADMAKTDSNFVLTPALIVDYAKPRPDPRHGGAPPGYGYGGPPAHGGYGGGYGYPPPWAYDGRRGYDDRGGRRYDDRYDDRRRRDYYDDRDRDRDRRRSRSRSRSPRGRDRDRSRSRERRRS